MKNILLMAAILIAYPLFAQSHPIRVQVGAGNAERVSSNVADRMAGRIGASSRYALVTKAEKTELLITVNCLPAKIDGQQVGLSCYTTVAYWPLEHVALFMPLSGMLVSGQESAAAEDLFDAFVEETSDEKLTKVASDFKTYLNSAIARFPHGVN